MKNCVFLFFFILNGIAFAEHNESKIPQDAKRSVSCTGSIFPYFQQKRLLELEKIVNAVSNLSEIEDEHIEVLQYCFRERENNPDGISIERKKEIIKELKNYIESLLEIIEKL